MPLDYGDTVQLTRKGVKVNALVVRADVVKVQKFKPTPTDPGIRDEEHLTIYYLDPQQKDSAHTGIGVERCFIREYGAKLDPEPEPDPAPAAVLELPAETEPPAEPPVEVPAA